MLASHWLRAFDPITQKILSVFTWSKKLTPTNIPLAIQWWAGTGKWKVWFGKNAGFLLVESIWPYNSENIWVFWHCTKNRHLLFPYSWVTGSNALNQQEAIILAKPNLPLTNPSPPLYCQWNICGGKFFAPCKNTQYFLSYRVKCSQPMRGQHFGQTKPSIDQSQPTIVLPMEN